MASLIYSIENQIFDGIDDYIDTGIKLFDTNKDFVIFLDFTADITQGENPIIFDAIDGSAWYGFAVVANEQMLSAANNTKAPQFETSVLGNRHCIAIRKQAIQGIYQFVVPNNAITGFTEILIDGISNKDVFIGAFQVGTSIDYPWKGTMHSCKIWFGPMTDEEFISLVNPKPIITIGTPSRTKISAVSGHDQSIVTFQSDMELQSWEARATIEGQTIGHGSGLLVESGGSLAANTDATVYVNDEELTQGDQEYTISVFGHGTDGYWSDGTYEEINLIDFDKVISYENATYSNYNIVFDTGDSNVNESGVILLLYKNNSYIKQISWRGSASNCEYTITKDDTFNIFWFGLSGETKDAKLVLDVSHLENGYDYTISYTITEKTNNHASLNDIKLVKAVV